MYTNIYRQVLRVYMAKLYWRVKLDGKWNWKSAGTILDVQKDKHIIKMIVATDGYYPRQNKIKKVEEPAAVVDQQRKRFCDENICSLSAEKKQECEDND